MNRGLLVLFIAVTGFLYFSLNSKLLLVEVPREKLSSIINSEYQEVRPLISPDGKTLYFSRRHHPENTGGVRDFQDIWVAHYQNGEWSVPVRISETLNNKKTNTLCSITSDGSYALLLDSYKRVKSPLAQAYNSPAGWGAPGDLLIKDFTNQSTYYDFYYQEQTQVLISAIDDGRGYGEQDLHVSFRLEDGSYSKPQNLGNAVNSSKSDFAPFLAADGKTLYFASFGHHGLGGSDFYVSYRLDDSWKKWTEPKNLGNGINSIHDENYLSITGDFSYIYFESYPNGAENKDIYRAILPQQFRPDNLAPAENTKTVITDATQQEVSEHGPEVPESATKNPSKKAGDAGSNEPSTINNLPAREYFQDGQVMSKILQNSYFPFDSYQLSAQAHSRLKAVASILQKNPDLEVLLEGHSDSLGKDEVNLKISYLRAQAAAHYLIDQGIPISRLQVKANGDLHPLASNDDEKEGRELNRRVEVILISSTTSMRVTIY